jgi:hypothetical protein
MPDAITELLVTEAAIDKATTGMPALRAASTGASKACGSITIHEAVIRRLLRRY